MREDAEDVVRVGLSAKLESSVTRLQRDIFDSMTVAELKIMGYTCLRFFLPVRAVHAEKVAARSCSIPTVFLDAAFSTCNCPLGHDHVKGCIKASAKDVTSEICMKMRDELNTMLGKSPIMSSAFKFSWHMGQLKDSVARYGQYLEKQATRMTATRESTEQAARVKAAGRIPAGTRHDLSPGDISAVARINAAMEKTAELTPVRVDGQLFTDDETEHNNTLAAVELKMMGVDVAMRFADDKSTAKVGEPGDAVAANSRNKHVLTTDAINGRIQCCCVYVARFKVNPTVMLLLQLADIRDDEDDMDVDE